MDIKRCGSQPSGKGPAEYFTGTVRIDPLNSPPDPARVAMALVTFEPGARTAWHTHPLGQTLIVTSGCGWVQRAAKADPDAMTVMPMGGRGVEASQGSRVTEAAVRGFWKGWRACMGC